MKNFWKSAVTVLVLFTVLPAFAEEKATKEECVAKCKAAAAMVKEAGVEKTMKVMMDPEGPFIWKDTYVFCFELDTGIMLAHPQAPGLVGKMTKGVKDKSGKLLFVAYANVALEKGEGWVEYIWGKPGEKGAFEKESFVYRVPDENLVMVAGIYK